MSTKNKQHANNKSEVTNSAQRKNMVKKYKEYYQKYEKISQFINNELDIINAIPEGTKVKLNYESIINDPNYNRKTYAYQDFIEKNKNKIFTVEYDNSHIDRPILVCLKEDENKWLFHSEYDLIVIDDN